MNGAAQSFCISGWHSPDIFVPRGTGNIGESKIFPGDPRKFPVVVEIRLFKRISFVEVHVQNKIDRKYIRTRITALRAYARPLRGGMYVARFARLGGYLINVARCAR